METFNPAIFNTNENVKNILAENKAKMNVPDMAEFLTENKLYTPAPDQSMLILTQSEFWYKLNQILSELPEEKQSLNFKRLDSLSVHFARSSEMKTGYIYANGRHQAKLLISAKITLQDNTQLSLLTFSDWLRFCVTYGATIELVNYMTGSPLDQSIWQQTILSNLFNPELISTDMTGEMQETVQGLNLVNDSNWHVACKTTDLTSCQVAVRIHIPGIGDFDTTCDGTSTINAPAGQRGSVFKSPNYCIINVLPPVDYSMPENVLTTGMPGNIGGFKTVVDDMNVNKKYTGISSKVIVTVRPKKWLKFMSTNVTSAPCDNQGFNITNDTCDDIWGDAETGNNTGSATFIFVNKQNYGLLPYNCINFRAHKDAHYRIGPNDERHYWSEPLDPDVITIAMCNHSIRRGAWPQGWKYTGNKMSVEVIDYYANTGTVTIEAPGPAAWPKLLINNQLA